MNMNRAYAYVVMYWDAYGNPHTTEKMSEAEAKTTASTMAPHQEACVVLVCK